MAWCREEYSAIGWCAEQHNAVPILSARPIARFRIKGSVEEFSENIYELVELYRTYKKEETRERARAKRMGR